MSEGKKIAVVLLNLGGPDSLDTVRPFLFNLFYDKAIIRLPNPFRWILANIISLGRKKKAQGVYSLLGGASPILKETKAQADALKKELGDQYEVFICMRYWHPMSSEVVSKVKAYNPNEIILLPLYPQFSTTTTGSSVSDFKNTLKCAKLDIKCKVICCYPTSPGFINAHVELIRKALGDCCIHDTNSHPREGGDENEKGMGKNKIIILFSAHGLPQKIVDGGDPYQKQIEQTVAAVVEKLQYKCEYLITYQSRVGPLEWLKPDTEEEIKIVAREGKTIIVVPIAFVSEHVETLVELDIEYGKIATDLGARYIRVPALGVTKAFIEDLADNVRRVASGDVSCRAYPEKLVCPKEFSGCLCKK